MSRLKDPKTQQTYYALIVQRYMELCASAGRKVDSLDEIFASMKLVDAPSAPLASSAPLGGTGAQGTVTPPANSASKRELGRILAAMRKLREALVASGRTDTFAKEATIFIVRAGILTGTYETYAPALQRLLGEIHPKTPLTPSELHEFRGFHLLDAACRRGEYAAAFAARAAWGYHDARVEGVLAALVRDEWPRFWRLRAAVDGYQRALLAWAEPEVRRLALKCLGHSYFRADRAFVERCAGRGWDELKALDQLGWELDGTTVTIRRVKKT